VSELAERRLVAMVEPFMSEPVNGRVRNVLTGAPAPGGKGVQLGVSRIDSAANDAAGWEQGEDAPMRCPIVVAEIPAVDQRELDKRASAMAAQAPALAVPTPQSRKP